MQLPMFSRFYRIYQHFEEILPKSILPLYSSPAELSAAGTLLHSLFELFEVSSEDFPARDFNKNRTKQLA